MTDTVRGQVQVLKDRNLVREVDRVILQVDYQIIEHFSENLYDSPNKAIEELVANGFDAFATQVNVFTPGPYTTSSVLVWDNGESMDVEGLKKLWWIARSPKSDGDRVEERDDRRRKLIGKFGIGKLASYSVGNILSHLCRHGPEFYLVSIDYGEVYGNGGKSPVSYDQPIRAPIMQMEEEHAHKLVRNIFGELPSSMDDMFNSETWTLAIIEDLKVKYIPFHRLMWVLGNGMPLRPDFAIAVNGDTVQSKLDKRAVVDWDFGTKEIVESIENRWRDAERDEDFHPIKQRGTQTGLDPANPNEEIPFIQFTHLGKVWGRIRLFDETLIKFRAADNGRSHGFFLFIRGRLMNPDDEKLFLPDPSFETFYRSQFIIYADDLDDELLADRQRLRRSESIRELGLLQRAIGGPARVQVEARDTKRAREQSTQSILPVGSRRYYRDPLNALLQNISIDEVSDFDPANVGVERRPLGIDRSISEFVLKEGAFLVNSLHPYYRVLEKRAGHSRAAREFLRTFDLFAISERLLEGHLLDLGFSNHMVDEIISWREGLFRQLAMSYGQTPELITEMYRTSYIGGRKFEAALYQIFEDMGFVARHDGGSGKEDIHVLATVGPESYSFIVEAKGSKSDVENRDAAVATAANHRSRVNADHAVIVARKFAGFGDARNDRDAALYKECQSTSGVSIMEIDAVRDIYQAIVQFSYPLPLLKDVFFTLDTPADKLSKIEKLTTPVTGFNYLALLEEIWRRQGDEAKGDVVPYRSIFQQGGWKDELEFDDFQRRLVALETLAAGRIRMNTTQREVYLRQSPDLVLRQIEKSLYGQGQDVPDSSHK